MILTSEETGCPVGVLNLPGCGKVGTAEALLYAAGDRIEVASPSARFERCTDLGQRQASTQGWRGCPTQDGHSVGMGQVPKRFQDCGIVLAQSVA